MYAASTVQWPSLGFWPGFASLATDPEKEFDPPYTTLGDITLPGGSTVPFPLTLDLSTSTTIAGVAVPDVLLYGAVAVLGLSLLGGLGKGRGRRSSSSTYRARKVAKLKGELAAAEA